MKGSDFRASRNDGIGFRDGTVDALSPRVCHEAALYMTSTPV